MGEDTDTHCYPRPHCVAAEKSVPEQEQMERDASVSEIVQWAVVDKREKGTQEPRNSEENQFKRGWTRLGSW